MTEASVNVSGFVRALTLATASLARAGNPPIPVPADISVSLVANPSENLSPGDPIFFTLSVTNHGPEAVDRLVLTSSEYYDEFDHFDASLCPHMIVAVADGASFRYLFFWYASDEGILAVGQTLSCQMRLTLTPSAPPVFTFSFFLPDFFEDINPLNDSATVYLRRAVSATTPVPVFSAAMSLLLVLLVATLGGLALRGAVASKSSRR